jgi:hypothetical protein
MEDLERECYRDKDDETQEKSYRTVKVRGGLGWELRFIQA